MAAGFAAAFAAVAVGVFLPATVRPALVLAAVAAVVLWITGEHFGALLSGSATDPNTGPLLVLLAAAFWPSAALLAHPAAWPPFAPPGATAIDATVSPPS